MICKTGKKDTHLLFKIANAGFYSLNKKIYYSYYAIRKNQDLQFMLNLLTSKD